MLLKPACGVLALTLASAAFAAADAFKDPLDIPAPVLTRQLVSTQMQAVARAGDRLVAVGLRGLVVFSDDGGKRWTQASVPVASDLTDVHFPTASDGWVVGHGGVVLRTRDGGRTWEKQLDGRMAGKLLTAHFQSLLERGDQNAKRYLEDTRLNYENGPEQALLGVWFKDALHGFVCGSFGTLLATRDGGVTWESWVEHVEADMPPHFYAIRDTRRGLLLASEKGTVYRLDPQRNRFIAMATGYAGTFFSLLETGDAVLAMGLRGNAFRWRDKNGKWEKVETGVAGTITASTPLPGGGALLATKTGQLLVTRDGGDRFRIVPVDRPMSYSGVAPAAPGVVVVAGSGGVRTIAVDPQK